MLIVEGVGVVKANTTHRGCRGTALGTLRQSDRTVLQICYVTNKGSSADCNGLKIVYILMQECRRLPHKLHPRQKRLPPARPPPPREQAYPVANHLLASMPHAQ